MWVKQRETNYVKILILAPPVNDGEGLARAAIRALFTVDGVGDAPPHVKNVKLYLVQNAAPQPSDAEERAALRRECFHPATVVGRDMHDKCFMLLVAGENELVSGESIKWRLCCCPSD